MPSYVRVANISEASNLALQCQSCACEGTSSLAASTCRADDDDAAATYPTNGFTSALERLELVLVIRLLVLVLEVKNHLHKEGPGAKQ